MQIALGQYDTCFHIMLNLLALRTKRYALQQATYPPCTLGTVFPSALHHPPHVLNHPLGASQSCTAWQYGSSPYKSPHIACLATRHCTRAAHIQHVCFKPSRMFCSMHSLNMELKHPVIASTPLLHITFLHKSSTTHLTFSTPISQILP